MVGLTFLYVQGGRQPENGKGFFSYATSPRYAVCLWAAMLIVSRINHGCAWRGVAVQMKRENKANENAHRQPEKQKSVFRLP